MTRSSFEVAVLGGGLGGTAMALAFAGQGFDVALLDPVPAAVRADPEFDGRAYAIAPGSANVLRALGVWEGIAEAEPVRAITATDPQPGPVAPAQIHFDPAETGAQTLGWIVEDRWLRQALMAALAASEITHLAERAAEGVSADTAWARVATADGEVRARLAVACDGRRSAIARAAGVTYLAWDYGQTGLVSAISHEMPHHGLAHQSFFAGGPFAVLPLSGNRSSLVWSDRRDRAAAIAALDDAAYMREIAARVGGRLGALELSGRRWAYPLSFALAHDFAAPRLAVAGDAAHGVHPIAGQGLNMALRDVAALVEVATEAARRGEDIGATTVLDAYQRWRRPDATLMALGMDGLNRLFSNARSGIQAVRNLGLAAAARSGTARRFFMGAAAGTAPGMPKMIRGVAV